MYRDITIVQCILYYNVTMCTLWLNIGVHHDKILFKLESFSVNDDAINNIYICETNLIQKGYGGKYLI